MIYRSHDKATSSRRALCAALFGLMLTPVAHAADWPGEAPLRGTVQPASAGVRWDGLVFGATFGMSSLNANFGNGASSQIAYILRNTTIENEGNVSGWTTLSDSSSNSRQFGGYLGYNWQMEDIILGADFAYNRMSSLTTSAGDTMTRIFNTSDSYTNTVSVRSSSSLQLVDYATLRGRAGYMMGQFLPYAMLGVAVGRFNYMSSATVTASGVSTAGGLPYGPSTGTNSTGKNNAFSGGALGGVGLDVALLPNVFMRAEYEFIVFSAVNGIRSNVSTGRLGVGVRF